MITDLAEDLIVEILLRLPVKSILQCGILCKQFCTLIRSPNFITRHQRLANEEDDHCTLVITRETENIHKFFRRSREKEPLDNLPNLISGKSFIIRGALSSSTGICCIFATSNSCRINRIILWNPATGEHHLLPFSPLEEVPCTVNCGFCFDNDTNDYKVLMIVAYHTLASSTFHIFSTSNAEWRPLVTIDDRELWVASLNIFHHYAVYVNGTFHWVYNTWLDSPRYSLLTFDMSREVIGSLLLPTRIFVNKWFTPSIATLNESLALFNPKGRSFEVWVMKEYGRIESWTLVYQHSCLPGIEVHFLGVVGDRFYAGEKQYWAYEDLLSYDLHSRDVERYGIPADRIKFILPYVPTLTRISKYSSVLHGGSSLNSLGP